MIKNEQTSSVVYGLFLEDEDKQVLLGLHFLEADAEAAREDYIAERLFDHKTGAWQPSDLRREERFAKIYLRSATAVRPLHIGRKSSYNFAS
jgi:hypothetical protein